MLGMAAVGYQAGLSATRRSPAMLALVLAFAVVLLLIADLDRGQEGLLRIGQQSMIDLQKSMQPADPRPTPTRAAAMTTPRYPSLYQINTRVWLTELSRQLGRPATLDDIPDAELDRLAEMGFDWIWLLSVWQTGPAAQQVSRTNPEWRREFEETLPDLTRRRHSRLGFRHHGLHGPRELSAAMPRWPGCASGCRSAASS